MMGLTLILIFSAWNTGNFYILLSACILAALLIVGYYYPAWAVNKIELVVERFPYELNDTTPVTIIVKGLNKGWLARRELFFELKAISPSKKLVHAISTRLPVINPGIHQIDLKLGKMRRGRYQLSKETAFYTGFPFGFVEHKKVVSTRQDNMAVYPYRFPVNNTIFDLGSVRNYAALQTRQNTGNSSEFFGIREYRYGDSIRHIDWKTTAKHNEVIVREFEEVTRKSFIVAVNCDATFTPINDTHDVFEKSVRIAASVATSLLHTQYPVGLYTSSVQLEPASDSGQEIRIMDVLTDTENLRLDDYWSRLYEFASNLSSPQAILLFGNGELDHLAEQNVKIRMLVALGHEVKVISFTAEGHQGIQIDNIYVWKVPVNCEAERAFFE